MAKQGDFLSRRGLSPERSRKHLFYSEVVQHADSDSRSLPSSLFVHALDDAIDDDPNLGDDCYGESATCNRHFPFHRCAASDHHFQFIGTDLKLTQFTLNETTNFMVNVKISARPNFLH